MPFSGDNAPYTEGEPTIISAGGGGGGGTLSGLTDTNITSGVANQSLSYDGSVWKNTSVLSIDTINNRVGINVANPTEDLEIDGNIQLDSSGANKVVFYDSVGGHEHAELDAENDGANGGRFIIKTKENGGVVNEALRLTNDRQLILQPQIKIDTSGNKTHIGQNSGETNPGNYTVGIGFAAGRTNAGDYSTSIGTDAGKFGMGFGSTAIGNQACRDNTNTFVIGIGDQANKGNSGGVNGTAVGIQAALNGTGNRALALGYLAGSGTSHDNTIILNAQTAALDSTGTDRLHIAPIRNNPTNQNATYNLSYNTTTKEVYYDRFRYDINTQFGGAGSTYTMGSDNQAVLYLRWMSGATGTWNVNLPNAALVRQGTRIIIKNGGKTTGQIVQVNPNGTNTIDGANLSVQLNCAARTTTGGGGDCITLVALDASNWMVAGAYHGTY